ncbi:MAG TPA: BON domain-containing protein [Terriglobia bacterium]|nr:BON domain-containing protein [Terriglobia bacterium]
MKNKLRLVIALLVIAPVLAGSSSLSAGLPAPGAKHHESPYSGQPRGYLERAVRHELLMLPYYSVFDDIEFRVDGYNVTLTGDVVWPTLRSDAGNVVKRIEGVQHVDNQIHVLPLSGFDNRIRRATYRAIYGYPTLQRYAIQPVPPIHIIVDNGHVTLKGVVANSMDRNVAYLRANGVPGVFSVTNQLRIEG